MTLKYPSPAAFAQAIRLRLQALPDDVPLLAVEGVSDRQAVCRIVHPQVRVFPARGKDMVLRSRAHLSVEERARCTFLIDCDGLVDPSWLIDGDVIVSGNRDLEADLVIELGAMRSLVRDFLAPLFVGGEELALEVDGVQAYVLEFTATMGVVLDAARALGYRTKIYDIEEGRRRRLRLLDVAELPQWLRHGYVPSFTEATKVLAPILEWSDGVAAAITKTAADGGVKLCGRHRTAGCGLCLARRFSNGHDLVDAAAIVLSDRAGFAVTAAEIARSLRIGSAATSAASWSVVERLRRRSETIGLPLIAA